MSSNADTSTRDGDLISIRISKSHHRMARRAGLVPVGDHLVISVDEFPGRLAAVEALSADLDRSQTFKNFRKRVRNASTLLVDES